MGGAHRRILPRFGAPGFARRRRAGRAGPAGRVHGHRTRPRNDRRARRAALDGRAAESCTAEDGTRFTDRFWIGPEDRPIWRAQQWIGPGRPAITFELVRPPTMP
jgi:hypothetical protein